MKKKIWLLPVAVILAAMMVLGLCACHGNDGVTAQLNPPVLTLNGEQMVSWAAIKGADGYIVNVNGEDLCKTNSLFYPCFPAAGTYTVKVQAVRGEQKGAYSNEITYTVYGVNVPRNEHCTIDGKSYILPGSDYSFSLVLSRAAYASKPVVTVDGQVVEPVDGVYTVSKVTKDITIGVDGLVIAEEYAVKLSAGEGYVLAGEKTAVDGLDYTFTLTLGQDYNMSKPVVKVNGQVVEPVDGVYTVEKPDGELTITVEGVEKNIFRITIPTGSGFVASKAGINELEPGQELRFTVQAAGGTRALAVTVEGTVLQPDEKTGEYSLIADKNYEVSIFAYNVVTSLYAPEHWTSDGWKCSAGSITVTDNATLSGQYLRQLWNAGYTHLVFTYTSQNKAAAFINGDSSNWKRYWSDLGDKSGKDIRVDINEFHTGSTWYDMQFINMVDGKGFTISNVRAYRSPETLQWEKVGIDASNLYFARENGYYVLETHAGGQFVKSPTQWLQKYCVEDDAAQRTWAVYSDYIYPGSNTRGVVWGWGEPVHILGDVEGGWLLMNSMQTDGYTAGEVFSLHLDVPATARFKISDIVSNRNGWNTGFSYTQLSDNSFGFTTDLDSHKFRLASTNELVDAGYRALKITLSGKLNGNVLWYGNGKSDGMAMVSEQELSADGTYTAELELAALEGELFQLHCQIFSGSITDMQVKLEPVGTATPPKSYQVTVPTGTGYTVSGEETAIENRSYAFTVTVEEGYDPNTLTVKVNDQIITGKNGSYVVDKVQKDLVITVIGPELYAYPVTAPSGNDFAFTGEASVKYGKDYVFRVTPDTPGNTVIVTVNGETLEGADGVYTVKAVKEALVIAVRCLDGHKYLVNIPTGNGYSVTPSGEQQVEYGKSISFTVTAKDPEATLIVSANGELLTATAGQYTIENVTDHVDVTISIYSLVEELLNPDNWNAGGTAGNSILTVPANSSLKGEYLKALWNEGYTHLVFTVTAESATNYTHGGNWERYWRGLTAGSQEIRIDINEFHDGDTWYSLNFSAGEMTVTNPRAYKSAETLLWTKIGAGTPSNVYFAIEDGYYVLETITGQGVTSPTEWLAKYCVADDAGQRSWRVYTDYISQGNNTRSALWGWGSAVNTLNDNVNGGWSWLSGMQTDGYTSGEVFSLHTDLGGTARFRILDWVSNRNEWNAAQKLEYVDDETIRWSGADSYKLRLATTQDIIASGATGLKVTLTGNLGSALIWYGEDDWGDGEVAIAASMFVNGSYTFTVDLTTFKENENFTLMGNAAAFTDLLVKVEPMDANTPVEPPEPTEPTEPTEPEITEPEITEPDTSEPPVQTGILQKLLLSESWSKPGTATANSLSVPANSALKADYLKALWNEGYTHLVFTVNAEAASDNNTNYTHSGTWDRYWRGITPKTNQQIRIDLNEFHDGDTWYGINFNSGSMTVSAPKAYKSEETLSWKKIGAGTPSNVYFAIEDGYYVLETITAQGVTSPTEWLAKYCVADDAGQRSWRVYTDYISQGNNTRSALWGWGTAMDVISGNANGGWAWKNGMQTDGYTKGEVFSLHTDVGGTARFKIMDWVSNRNEWNAAQKLEYVDAETIRWSGADGYKLRLATTQDLIAAGATKLRVTLTGNLGSAIIWYGEDDWSDGENAIDAAKFVNGACTFEVDLTTFKENENFTLMGNAAAFTDLLVKIEPITE